MNWLSWRMSRSVFVVKHPALVSPPMPCFILAWSDMDTPISWDLHVIVLSFQTKVYQRLSQLTESWDQLTGSFTPRPVQIFSRWYQNPRMGYSGHCSILYTMCLHSACTSPYPLYNISTVSYINFTCMCVCMHVCNLCMHVVIVMNIIIVILYYVNRESSLFNQSKYVK